MSEWAAAEDAAAHTFVESLDDAIEITGADGHHLQRVRRLRVGEHVTAADGSGNWRRYEVDAIAPGQLRLSARSASRVEPLIVPRVALAVALTKAGALDTVVARCTELGVARVIPIRTSRCVVRWDAAQAERAVERLRTTAREASAQSRRARLPEITPVAALGDLAGHPGLVVADPGGASARALELPIPAPSPNVGALHPIVRIDAKSPNQSGGEGSSPETIPELFPEWLVVVGPEGGLDPAELALLDANPHLSLGPHVLRAETAPIAAVAILVDFARDLWREW